MAGIGWKLQRLIDRDTLAGQLAAYMTGVAVTSAPWLLTTAVLVVLRLTSSGERAAELSIAEQLMTWIYAITLILCAPIQVVASRYAADRLYDLKIEGLAPTLRRILAATLVGFMIVGIVLVLVADVNRQLAGLGVGLTVIVGAQWLMLSVGGGLCSPSVVLRAYAIGAPISVVCALAFERGVGLGGSGYMAGFALGQLVALALLIAGTFRALPAGEDESARIAPAFRIYWMLGAAAFVYHLAIWSDKVAVWLVAGGAAAQVYTTAAAFAWLSVIPAFAWIYVQVETVFYQRYRLFYDGIEGGATLDELRSWSKGIAAEARRIVRGAALIQLLVSGIALAAATTFMHKAMLGDAMVPTFRLLLVGSALLVVTLLGLLLLSYFDRRRDSLIVAIVLLVANLGLTLLATEAGVSPALGYVGGCAIGCGLSLFLVRRSLESLLVETFQSQPFR
jgi:uncharacterized membrane protein